MAKAGGHPHRLDRDDSTLEDQWRPSAGTEMAPWKAVSWTPQDLNECVELWGMIVETVERKLELEKTEALVGLMDAATVDAARVPAEGFAQNFILQARKPRFKFVAPGLRIPTAEEFIDQPFTFAPKLQGLSAGDIPPILMFRADGLVNTADLAGFHYPYAGSAAIVQECPCGLYIDHCDPEMPSPFEDGCRLVLPFRLDGGFAKQGDSANVEGYDTILHWG
ncbi:hypothetical protein LTR12_002040 [Friedmanniomyces endolithicus]|nr:hypothetical protein LTR12_002040 [Friedmanniomyces endolithicus]